MHLHLFPPLLTLVSPLISHPVGALEESSQDLESAKTRLEVEAEESRKTNDRERGASRARPMRIQQPGDPQVNLPNVGNAEEVRERGGGGGGGEGRERGERGRKQKRLILSSVEMRSDCNSWQTYERKQIATNQTEK